NEAITFPEAPLPIRARASADFASPPELRVTWLGHSTLLIEIDGHRLLTDPVWGERTSPFTHLGPRRFHPPPLPITELPALDAVVISHDHYDHLDLPTIEYLRGTGVRFVVPLGIGSHLESWGVPRERIVERDWWQSIRVGALELVSTPARHFSGRGTSRDGTLWTSWAILGPQHRVYFSGDTAMQPEFEEIGRRLGPFDLTMLESGAYNALWADVHLGPEQAVAAHRMLRGKRMIPVHWGTFNLALHTWMEPPERIRQAAKKVGVDVVVPRPGESVTLDSPNPTPWWPQLPCNDAQNDPIRSSHLPPGWGLLDG
ncbi:MAG TPA: MBL fold metallo-hydrolase, partial [Polyangiaceae bacterium]|nr:MBL fold metallo-hydrolase [Polyangiaceae bacterium]